MVDKTVDCEQRQEDRGGVKKRAKTHRIGDKKRIKS